MANHSKSHGDVRPAAGSLPIHRKPFSAMDPFAADGAVNAVSEAPRGGRNKYKVDATLGIGDVAAAKHLVEAATHTARS